MDNSNTLMGLSPYEKMVRIAAHIKPGMCRAQVDFFFPQSKGGIQGKPITIYSEFPGGRVEVAYNNNGGSYSLDNQVVGTPKVFMTINW